MVKRNSILVLGKSVEIEIRDKLFERKVAKNDQRDSRERSIHLPHPDLLKFRTINLDVVGGYG